jgi:AraC-like DNA-binding protein
MIILADMVFIKTMTNNYYFYFTRFYYYPFFIGISILTYWIGVEGFNRRKVQKTKLKPAISSEKKVLLMQIAQELNDLMKNDKAYLNPELNLQKTAEHLQVKPYLVTQCLNVIINTKFNDYINGFRVNEVKRLLAKPEKKRLNLLTIAFEAGFNSKSSFNRSVKNQLGIHPKELR